MAKTTKQRAKAKVAAAKRGRKTATTTTTTTGPRRGVVQIEDVKPAPYNPRKIKGKHRAALSNSLDRWGLVQPIVVNERTGHIVGGNQRFDILRERGVSQVEAVIVDLPAAEEKALNLALNNPHAQGQFTPDLQAVMEEIRGELGDALDESMNFGKLVAQVIEAADDAAGAVAATYAVMVQCDSEEEQQELFRELEGEGYSCRLLTS